MTDCTALGVIGLHKSSHTIPLPGHTHSTIVCLVVHLSEVQAELLNLFGDGFACNSGIIRETPRTALAFHDNSCFCQRSWNKSFRNDLLLDYGNHFVPYWDGQRRHWCTVAKAIRSGHGDKHSNAMHNLQWRSNENTISRCKMQPLMLAINMQVPQVAYQWCVVEKTSARRHSHTFEAAGCHTVLSCEPVTSYVWNIIMIYYKLFHYNKKHIQT